MTEISKQLYDGKFFYRVFRPTEAKIELTGPHDIRYLINPVIVKDADGKEIEYHFIEVNKEKYSVKELLTKDQVVVADCKL